MGVKVRVVHSAEALEDEHESSEGDDDEDADDWAEVELLLPDVGTGEGPVNEDRSRREDCVELQSRQAAGQAKGTPGSCCRPRYLMRL